MSADVAEPQISARRLVTAARHLAAPFMGAVVALALAGPLAAPPAAAAEEVDLELVLAVDISFSMDVEEQRLQRLGYLNAITSPEVVAAIRSGLVGRVAVAYVEWAGAGEQQVVVAWRTISDATSAEAFADALTRAPLRRAFRTSIAEAIAFSTELIETNGYEGMRRVIDVSGDGPNNQGRIVTAMRDRAIAQGITVNGLPLLLKRSYNSYFDIPDLDRYYETCVIGGAGAFSEPVREIEAFGEAVRRKLVLEIAAPTEAAPRVVPVQAPAADGTAPAPAVDPFCLIGERIWRERIGDDR